MRNCGEYETVSLYTNASSDVTHRFSSPNFIKESQVQEGKQKHASALTAYQSTLKKLHGVIRTYKTAFSTRDKPLHFKLSASFNCFPPSLSLLAKIGCRKVVPRSKKLNAALEFFWPPYWK